MIYPIKNNEKIVPGAKNLCIILNGSITIEMSGENYSVAQKSFFFFDSPFNIVAASPFIEGFVTSLDEAFLQNFPDIGQALDHSISNFKAVKIKDTESKRTQIQSLLDAG
jgi:hypothetical protein